MAVLGPPKQLIPVFLGRVRALQDRHEARRAVVYAAAAVLGLVVLLPLLGYALAGSRATAIAVLSTGGLVVGFLIVAALVFGFFVPRRRFTDDAAVARWVGTRHKPVASDLLSAVELARAPERPGAPSQALVDALITSTGEQLDEVRPEALFDRAPMRLAWRWLIAAACVNLLVLAGLPHVIGQGWRALVAAKATPFDGAALSDVPLVGDLEATLEFPAYSRRAPVKLPSSSGDVRGLPGTTVTLRARVLQPSKKAELVLDGEGEPKIVEATLEGDQLTAKLVIGQTTRYRFALYAPTGLRSIETTPRMIEAEPDQAPIVQLMAPADPLDVTNLRRVELAYVIEDDFGITSAELVWEAGPMPGRQANDKGRKAIELDATSGRAQGKVLWDIAEVQVPSGGEVRYWLEAKDNDDVTTPNVGKSRELRLKVVSPRERHEETLGRHQDVAEKILKNLGLRLTMDPDAPAPREEVSRQLKEAVIELGSVAAAFEKDPHASDAMRKALTQMRERLDRLTTTEQKWIPKGKTAVKGAYTALDTKLIAELEDDSIVLADGLDRERLEGTLDIADEISAHQKRLADLLAQYQKTKDPRLLDEIEREMKALDRSFAELEKHRRGMPEDVLDQYVNRDAMQAAQGTNCMDEVRKLVRAGQTAQAQQKLEQCRAQHDRSAAALEGSLAGLRGDRFSDEQKKLDEVMNELADVAKDQDDIAAEANRLFEAYAEKADEVSKDKKREASKKVTELVGKLRRRIKDIDESGLTPFAKEEMDIVERRLKDVETMAEDGDLAEATGMAHQAKQSLDTIAGELEAAIEDDPKSKWADATQDALDDVYKARPIAKELIEELQSLTPRPDQIMSSDDMKSMDRLKRRQQMNQGRAKKLMERTKQLGAELPGDTGQELGKKLGTAVEKMGSADDRMKARDPSGTREATRSAADALAKARDRARSAARQAQEGANVGEEPIRIPGADEYRAPARFREDVLEAQKKGKTDGYEDQIKRYYEDLIK
jgi:hypothetical protein